MGDDPCLMQFGDGLLCAKFAGVEFPVYCKDTYYQAILTRDSGKIWFTCKERVENKKFCVYRCGVIRGVNLSPSVMVSDQDRRDFLSQVPTLLAPVGSSADGPGRATVQSNRSVMGLASGGVEDAFLFPDSTSWAVTCMA
ncbi:hypothetical protein RRG08_033657 [Elysia crispata]|uniref:Uncharacterized protein n=1 Tax=Elysia crispata TaxID=231223 RepID=A0AAE0YME2_9GAST|nr:hypothetical protein RRG08_033657 [Elysia crispata]